MPTPVSIQGTICPIEFFRSAAAAVAAVTKFSKSGPSGYGYVCCLRRYSMKTYCIPVSLTHNRNDTRCILFNTSRRCCSSITYLHESTDGDTDCSVLLSLLQRLIEDPTQAARASEIAFAVDWNDGREPRRVSTWACIPDYFIRCMTIQPPLRCHMPTTSTSWTSSNDMSWTTLPMVEMVLCLSTS